MSEPQPAGAELAPAEELTDSQKLDAVYRFITELGNLMMEVSPMIQKMAEHPMVQAFLS